MRHARSAGTVRVDVPADEAFLGLLRVTAASAAAEHAGPLDRLDDVRLAVGELAAGIVGTAERGRTLHVDIEVAPDQLTVRGRVTDSPGTPRLSEAGELLVTTVSDAHRLGRDGDDLVFDLDMRLPGTGGATTG